MSGDQQPTGAMTREEIAQIIETVKQGDSFDGLLMLDAASKVDALVAQGAQISKPLILGDDLLFVQPDGTIIGLLDGTKADSVLRIEDLTIPIENIVAAAVQTRAWESVADAVEVELNVLETGGTRRVEGSGEQEPVLAGDPLIGIGISPLLPPTDYSFPEFRDRDVGAGGVGESDIEFGGAGSILVQETDGGLGIRFADFVVITAGGAADGEAITGVRITLPGLPLGTTANFGSFVNDGGTLTFVFDGTPEEYRALVLTFPADFSTDSRTDFANGNLTATIVASSNFIGDATYSFPVRVEPEGDLDFAGTGVLRLPETDAPVVFDLAQALTPQATDADGSESVTSVSLELTGLPAGAAISTDGGVTFTPVGPTFTFTGTLAEYEMLRLQVPADFSTTNPASNIIGILQATTDEGADETRTFELVVDATPDIVIAPPRTIAAVEDGDGVNGGGVTVDLDLDIVVDDADGSEANTTVSITFTDLPPGSVFSNGAFSAVNATWTGTVAEANALTVLLPGDYSGTFSSSITASNIEGSSTANQTVIVTAAGDVNISVTEIVTPETDAPVVIDPSASWQVTVTDLNGSPTFETLQSVTLTLTDLPPGVIIRNVPTGTFTYDPVAGGAFSFTGTPAQYGLLRLVFPEDFSTESPALPGGVISGTVSGVSNEGSGGPEPVALRITPEGDALLSAVPFAPLTETETPQSFVLGQVLNPRAVDNDGSESIEEIELVITGLPSIGFTLANITGLPSGTSALTTAADGSQTLVALFTQAEFSDVRAAFMAAEVTLPGDFSTANRSDLTSGTSLPIAVTASMTTDEDQDNSVDGPTDGQATQTVFVNVDFLEDIDLTIPIEIFAQEDGGVVNSSVGVTVPLNILIAITDDDGSETDLPGTPFSATVQIEFTDLPTGAGVTTGSLVGGIWTGTVDDARALSVTFPGNYAGTSFANVTVTTPEGSQNSPTTIVVTPTPDINITGEVITTETDADLPILLSDFINLTIDPVNETLFSLTFSLPGLPAGTVALDPLNQPVGTFVPSGAGTVEFVFDTALEPTVDPSTITLVVPTDFSTVNPNLPLQAVLTVQSVTAPFPPSPPVTATIDFTIQSEGDVQINTIGTAALAETDAPVDFKPSDYLQPQATDLDGSESVTSVNVTFNALPSGTLFSVDGITFAPATAALNFVGTLSEYNTLVVRLPADFSTQSPGTTLTGTVIAATDEFGVANDTFNVTVSAEGDVLITGPGTLTLSENDAPGSVDLDATTQAPLQFRLADVLTAQPTDADGSETISSVDININDLPAGARVSLDGGVSFGSGLPAGSFTLNLSSLADYEDVFIRLPDDFSTQRTEGPITGTLTFSTDEGLLNGETVSTPNGGVLSQPFSVTVLPEGDVLITGSDLVVIEDLGTPIDLNLAASIVDIDGSETLTSVTVTFSGLPTNGPTQLSDGTLLTSAPGGNVWTGAALSDLTGLSIVSFPQHFSGIVTMTTTVVTNETGPAGQSAVFDLDVTPVAEPVIALTVDDGPTTVTELAPGQFAVKEDSSFLLQISASTPDQDGSETLSQIVIDNMPQGWLRSGDGAVSLARFETGSADIASAQMNGTRLTITLNPGVNALNADLRVIPLANADQDAATLTSGDLVATVTSVDTAAGLASDSATAQASVNADVDAVVDGMDLRTTNRGVDENITGRRLIDAGFTRLQLDDADGSEVFDAVTFTITVNTLSNGFDPAMTSDLRLDIRSQDVANVIVTRTDTVPGDNVVEFTVVRAPGASNAEFAAAITRMRVDVPQKFSGRAILEGEVTWSETQTGDVEFDTTDNAGSESFRNVLTVRPLAEATLNAGVFVRDANYVASGSPQQIASTVAAVRTDASATNTTRLTLVESTADGSGFGQVQAFLRLNAFTADTDGSEELDTLVIRNLPSSWLSVAHTTGNLVLDRSMFFTTDGSATISLTEFNKITSAVYNGTTGALTLTFAPDVTSFAGAVAVYPALYEDYDVNRRNTDQFSADGSFFGADLNFDLTVQDGNTVTQANVSADLTVDVDVDPINNRAFVLAFPVGNEAAIDNLPGGPSGIFDFSFLPLLQDMDGSETIRSTVLRNVPDFLTVFVNDPTNPTGPKVPALLTSINGNGTLDWSLNQGQWSGVELRGVPLHFAGTIPIQVDIISREANGRSATTRLDPVNIVIEPVVDGGDPSETVATTEDSAIAVTIDGNIIDRTPESPEVILQSIEIFDVAADSFGRVPRFFAGAPVQTGTGPGGDPIYANEILPVAAGSYLLTPAQAQSLHVLPGQDSNENAVFRVRVIYEEQIAPLEFTTGEGTITVEITGIADAPIVDVQIADPDTVPGGIDKSLIDADFRPTDTTDGVLNADRAYAYAGFDDMAFTLTQRVSDAALVSGFNSSSDPIFTAADPLSGVRSEITFANGLPDGSETIYYIITDVPAGIRLIGGSPVDPTGASYVVTGAGLANLRVEASAVTETTYYDMRFHAIVLEDDADLSSVRQIGGGVTAQDVLNDIDALQGGSVRSEDFSVMVLSSGNSNPGNPCLPGDPEWLPVPQLTLVPVGSGGLEDQPNPYQIQITPVAGYWSTIADLVSLPNGVNGDFGFGLTLPPGSSLTGSPAGAVLFDPVTGQYVIDFAALGVDGTDPTLTAGTIIYTPPPHQSSPVNPFDPSETLGTQDPYDNLDDIQFTSVLNNFTCNVFDTATGPLVTEIAPVVDGPTIAIGAASSVLEDVPFLADIQLSSADGGERLVGNVVITLGGDPTAQLFGPSGLITPDAGSGASPTYTLLPSDIAGLEVRPTEHFSGTLSITVSASTEDIDNSVLTSTATRTITVVAVADTPEAVFNPDPTPTETGLPFVTDPTGPNPIVTALEDQEVYLRDIFTIAGSPDQDGSEVGSAVVGPLPEYLELGGASTGIIDNGDGTFTVSQADFANVYLKLSDTHARTPDDLDPNILAEIPVGLSFNTLELSNSDEATFSTQFTLRVFPDADKPTVNVSVNPANGTEDDGTVYALTLEGNTPDPHETMSFEITVPAGGQVLLDGLPLVASPGGIVSIPGVPLGVPTTLGTNFVPSGAVTFIPPADFGGTVTLDVVAVTSDTSTTYAYTDTESSDTGAAVIAITPTPDLAVSATDPVVVLPETDAAVSFSPASNVVIAVTDTDGSEIVDGVSFEMTGLPAGTVYSIGGADIPVTGTLSFSGTDAEFAALVVTLPADFSTNGTPLTATVTATTNEGGNETASFSVDIPGELDLALTVAPPDLAQPETGSLIVDMGLTAQVTDTQTVPSETLETVVIQFNTPLPVGSTASDGVLSADRSTLTFARGALSPTDFALAIAALSLTVPASFAGDIDGIVRVSTNHGTAPDEAFSINVNARPVISGPVQITDVFDTSISIPFADLYANATDSTALTIENVASADPLVQISVSGTDVTVTVPGGYVGTPVLTYDVVDSGAVPARSSTSATVEIDTLQMQDSGVTQSGPDGVTRAVMTDVTGDPAFSTVAKGTSGNDQVTVDPANADYAGVTAFDMMAGSDFVDLTNATRGFAVDGGSGNDLIIGSGFDDRLTGGAGFDQLTGGSGADDFVLGAGPITIADAILDFEAGDQVDLSAEVNGVNDITGIVGYNSATGALSVNGATAFNIAASGGGLPAQVEVIFEDSAGAAQTAVV